MPRNESINLRMEIIPRPWLCMLGILHLQNMYEQAINCLHNQADDNGHQVGGGGSTHSAMGKPNNKDISLDGWKGTCQEVYVMHADNIILI